MIKLFRNIRLNSLMDSKTDCYFKCAIEDIFLSEIGSYNGRNKITT